MRDVVGLVDVGVVRGLLCFVLVCFVVFLAGFFGVVGSAFGALASAGFSVGSFASPTHFAVGDTVGCESSVVFCDEYVVSVTDVGELPTDGSPVVVRDEVPVGLRVVSVQLPGAVCSTVPVRCEHFGVLVPDQRLEMSVRVEVESGVSGGLHNVVSVSGGGAAEVAGFEDNVVGGPAGFGFSEFVMRPGGVDGLVDSQAGDHPYEVSFTFGLNNVLRVPPDGAGVGKTSVQDVKDVAVDLPLGFVGSTLSAPECTLAQLSSQQECPADTRVGMITTEPNTLAGVLSPIWNLVPEKGYPAEFGFLDGLKGSHVLYAHVVPSPVGYVLETVSPDIGQITLDHVFVTFFGDPAKRDGTGNAEVPFFTNPTICSAVSMTATAHMDSWLHPGRFHADGTPDYSDPAWVSKSSVSPPPTGCNLLSFGPELKAQPTTHTADSPSGLDFELKLAQSETAGTTATAPLRDASVAFPAGFSINPAAGDGLAACSEAQIGWEGPAPADFNREQPACPEASKIGVLELESPLIRGVLKGAMYLAAQNANPFGSVFGLYVVVDDPVTGVLIKIAGRAIADPGTGQITGVFNENPQLPFSDLKLHFFGGPRAEFATPESCATFTTTSVLEPWSAPDSGPASTPSDSFPVNTGCVGGFAPVFTALSSNVQAGAYTPFIASFSRSDTDQEMGGLSVSLPPGLEANIKGVPLCPDANAAAGTCSEASRVGSVKAGAGPGPNPLFVTGSAYLTGPYKGAPYGLSVVVPAIAGPFNFGNVVVRQALYIDSHDAHVTDVSDPFPTFLRPTGADGNTVGVPIRLRRVDVQIDRPGFTFNPTNCSKLQVSATMTSTQNQTTGLTAPFQVTNCAALKFAPKFTVTTSGKPTKAGGASLNVKLTNPVAPQGTQANIASVKVDLPKQLPSRLTTLQKACLAKTFETNPANCPAGSIIGHAKVTVPILPLPLAGPVYFVSHGGEAFPSLTIVLQGNGVTVQLVGATFISKKGITSTTFKTTPDVPFNTFELTLPQGANSALAANGNLCTANLTMPAFFHAQNGLQLHQATHITPTNCPHKHHKHSHKHHH